MKIILTDDHPVFRSGMASILADIFDGAEIIEAGDAKGLYDALDKTPEPDLVVVDLFFPGFDCNTDLTKLRKRLSLTPIIAISMMNDLDEIENIISYGINGFISKSVSPAEIISAIKDVMNGEIAIRTSDEMLGHTTAPILSHFEDLTSRQIEILRLLRGGLSNKEIARELDLSPFTVRTHVSALLKALGVSTRAAASALAAGRGLAAK